MVLKLGTMKKARFDPWVGNSAFKVSSYHRVYAIGDLHGRIDLLRTAVDMIDKDIQDFDDGRDPLIVFLGDYIDRGDNTRDVLDFLMELECMRPANCVFLQGNHEEALLDFVENPLKGKAWLDWGGTQTVASFGIAPPLGTPKEDELLRLHEALMPRLSHYLPFIQLLRPYYVSGEIVFAHASLEADLPLEHQPKRALLWGETTTGSSSTIPGFKLVHGHFAGDEPVLSDENICVDTGAYYSGKLTILRLDGHEHFIFAKTGDKIGS